MPQPSASVVLETIINVAEEIALVAPECADRAMKIVELAGELNHVPDREAVQDAIESNLIDTDLSDPKLQSATSAVMAAVRSGEAGQA